MSDSPGKYGAVPDDCDRIIIVGAGGFGREVLQWARHAWPEHVSKIAGFLSDDPTKLDGHATKLPILGSPEDFEPRPTDGLLLAIGIPGARRKVAEQLEAREARFLTLIHPAAIVADTAQIGAGSIICPFAIVSDSAAVAFCSLLNCYSTVAHDACVGRFSILSPYAAISGNARIGDEVFLGMHACVGPGRTIGRLTRVCANSCVLNDSPDDVLVFGVPGKIAPRLGGVE